MGSATASHGTRAFHVGVRHGHSAVYPPRVGILDIRCLRSICGPESALNWTVLVYLLFSHLAVQVQPVPVHRFTGEPWATACYSESYK
jgi:hypothetical protein